MKCVLCSMLIICFALGEMKAQNLPDSLQLVESALSYSFYQGPMQVGHNRLKVIMKNCPIALDRYEKGKQTESFGILLAAIGLVTSAASLGNYYFNQGTEFPTGPVAAGAICFGVGIPIYFSGTNKTKSSVWLFNQKCAK